MLAAKGLYRRIAEFTFAFGLALIATTLIAALVPAIGVYQQIGLDPASLPNLEAGAYLEQLRDLPPTRDGTLRHLDLLGLAGIVTFPSFHAASAVLYSWALWGARWIRPIVVVANGALLLATPIVGSHYFIDIFAGIAIARSWRSRPPAGSDGSWRGGTPVHRWRRRSPSPCRRSKGRAQSLRGMRRTWTTAMSSA